MSAVSTLKFMEWASESTYNVSLVEADAEMVLHLVEAASNPIITL